MGGAEGRGEGSKTEQGEVGRREAQEAGKEEKEGKPWRSGMAITCEIFKNTNSANSDSPGVESFQNSQATLTHTATCQEPQHCPLDVTWGARDRGAGRRAFEVQGLSEPPT